MIDDNADLTVSFPSRERGLKRPIVEIMNQTGLSFPSRERGLKHLRIPRALLHDTRRSPRGNVD